MDKYPKFISNKTSLIIKDNYTRDSKMFFQELENLKKKKTYNINIYIKLILVKKFIFL